MGLPRAAGVEEGAGPPLALRSGGRTSTVGLATELLEFTWFAARCWRGRAYLSPPGLALRRCIAIGIVTKLRTKDIWR